MSNSTSIPAKVKLCSSCKTNPTYSPRASYCTGCKESNSTGPRLRTKLHTSVRLMKGVRLNLNLPLFKL